MTHLPGVKVAPEPGAGSMVSACLLVSLPEFGKLPQWFMFFSGAIEEKGGYNKEVVG
jgi:hypothetical protein